MHEIDRQVDDFMLYCESKALSRKTLASYEQTLRLFSAYLKNEHDISDVRKVNTEHLREYIKYLRDRGKYTVVSNETSRAINHPQNRPDAGKSLSETTIANYLRNVKVFFAFMHDDRVIKVNPAKKIKNIKPKRRNKKLLSEFELKALMRTFETSTYYGYRSYTITRILLDTGMRIGECLSLLPEDVDYRNRAILIRGPKNKQDRHVFFSVKMSRELKRWMNYRDRYIDSEWLFPTTRGTKIQVPSFEKTLREHGKRVGIEVAPHILRNNFAKYYLMNGGDVISLSRILGHSSVEVTKVYLDFDDKELGQRYQRHSPLNNLDI